MALLPFGICSFLYSKPLALACMCWDCWGSMAVSITQGAVCAGGQEGRGMLLGRCQHGEGIRQEVGSCVPGQSRRMQDHAVSKQRRRPGLGKVLASCVMLQKFPGAAVAGEDSINTAET